MTSPRVSVAVPLFNEERCLPELLQRVRAVLDTTPGGPHELVFVNDGSTDRTNELLEAAAAQDPRIVVVSLSRNFGHQAALSAALDHVTGDLAVIMDGDLQDPPEMIPRFIEEFGRGSTSSTPSARTGRKGGSSVARTRSFTASSLPSRTSGCRSMQAILLSSRAGSSRSFATCPSIIDTYGAFGRGSGFGKSGSSWNDLGATPESPITACSG